MRLAVSYRTFFGQIILEIIDAPDWRDAIFSHSELRYDSRDMSYKNREKEEERKKWLSKIKELTYEAVIDYFHSSGREIAVVDCATLTCELEKRYDKDGREISHFED